MTWDRLWSTPYIAGILASLVHTAAQMPESTYKNGYLSALEAVGLALGTVEPREDLRRAGAVPTVFDDLTHEAVPYPFAAFATLGE